MPSASVPTETENVLSDVALTAVLRRMGCPFTAHGFRSALRDWAGETTPYQYIKDGAFPKPRSSACEPWDGSNQMPAGGLRPGPRSIGREGHFALRSPRPVPHRAHRARHCAARNDCRGWPLAPLQRCGRARLGGYGLPAASGRCTGRRDGELAGWPRMGDTRMRSLCSISAGNSRQALHGAHPCWGVVANGRSHSA
jgi:hypothetical protein